MKNLIPSPNKHTNTSLMVGLAFTSTVLMSTLSANNASAAVLIQGTETAGNVVFSVTGSLDLNGLPAFSSFTPFSAFILPEFPAINVGDSGNNSLKSFTVTANTVYTTKPSPFGSGAFKSASSGSGDTFWIGSGNDFDFLALNDSYASNQPIVGSSIFNSATFASLGVTPGTYIWKLVNGETVTLNISSAPTPPTTVPEPSTVLGTMVMMGVGAMFRKSKKN